MGVVMDVPFFANSVSRISVAVRAALGSSGSVAVLSFALASSASAQTAGPEEVIVTGQRLSIETAQEIKRNAEQIVDSVAAVDISALPDRTVTEALQRVPGITIDRMFQPGDTNRFSAEGSGVLIRGLTQVRSELNGRDVFSARNTRALSFDDVPAELMAGVDVYKNPSADMIEGGLAGTVNLRTRRPFDADDRQFGVSGSLNYGDFVEETKPQASMLLSDRWQTGIGEIGVLAHVAYSELATRTDSIQYGRPFRRAASEVGNPTNVEQNCVDMTGGPAFSCVYIPQGTRWSELDFDRERLGYSAAIQWAPNDAVEVYAQALRSDYKMNWVEHSAWFQDWVYDLQPAPGTAFTFDSRGVFQSGTFVTTGGNAFDRGVGTGTTTRTAKTHQVTSDYSIGVKVDATERLALSADVQYVKATANNNDLTVNSQSRPPTLTLDMSGSLPQVSAPTDYFGQRGNYFWAAAMDDTQKNEGSEFAVRFDGEYSLETGWLNSIQAGVRYADREATNRDTGYNWAPITETWNGASSLSMLDTVLTEQSTFFGFDNFYRGRTNLPSGIWVANESLVRNLTGSSATIVQSAERGGFFVWAPDKFRESDINEQQEKSLAGFGMLRFGGDIGSMALDGNIGARVVRIEREAAGFVQLPLIGGNVDPEFVAQYGTGLWQPVSVEDEDTYVLPSLEPAFEADAGPASAARGVEGDRESDLRQATCNDNAGRGSERAGPQSDRWIHGFRRQSVAEANASDSIRRFPRMVFRAIGFVDRYRLLQGREGLLHQWHVHSGLLRSAVGSREHREWRARCHQGIGSRLRAVLRSLAWVLEGSGRTGELHVRRKRRLAGSDGGGDNGARVAARGLVEDELQLGRDVSARSGRSSFGIQLARAVSADDRRWRRQGNGMER